MNSRADIERIIRHVREQLSYIKGAPSVQMRYIPPDIQGWRAEVEEELKAARLERDEVKEERDGAGGLLAKASRRRELERNGFQGGNARLGDLTA